MYADEKWLKYAREVLQAPPNLVTLLYHRGEPAGYHFARFGRYPQTRSEPTRHFLSLNAHEGDRPVWLVE